jgi:hypothetical protein
MVHAVKIRTGIKNDMRHHTALLALAVGILCAALSAAPPQSERDAGAVPTFTKDVAPILFAQCTSCHRPGQIAPMSLLTYEQARPWARSIREQVTRRAMPPWHADAPHGTFENERHLTDAERDTLVHWADGGAPQGDPSTTIRPAVGRSSTEQHGRGLRTRQPER